MDRLSNVFGNTMTLKDLKDKEREINDKYRNILLKKEELERKQQLPSAYIQW